MQKIAIARQLTCQDRKSLSGFLVSHSMLLTGGLLVQEWRKLIWMLCPRELHSVRKIAMAVNMPGSIVISGVACGEVNKVERLTTV